MSRLGTNKYTRLLSNTMLFGISTFSSKILSFLLTRLYTGVMAQGEFGLADFVVNVANLLIPLVSLGISNAVIRFGLEKGVSRTGVFTGGLAAIFAGFGAMALLYPLLVRIPLLQGHVWPLYLYVLISCLRTLCCQFVRSQLYIRLYAVDGIASTLYTVGFNVLFLVVLRMGATGYLLSVIAADALSTLGLFLLAGLHKYVRISGFDAKLLKSMLRYCLPLVPALMMWWVVSASDRMFISVMLGEAANGLYAAATRLPSIVSLFSTIFTEAWQLSAFTDGKGPGRDAFFSRIYSMLEAVVFVAGAGLILLCRPIMRLLVAPGYFEAWRYVPTLIIAMVFACLVSFFNSIYMLEKKSVRSLVTMAVGAVANLGLNAWLIHSLGPGGAALATLISYVLVYVVRAVDTRRYIAVRLVPAKTLASTLLLAAQTGLMLYNAPLWPLWCSLLAVLTVVLNGRALYGSVRQLFSYFRQKSA